MSNEWTDRCDGMCIFQTVRRVATSFRTGTSTRAARATLKLFGQRGEVLPVFAGDHFVEHFAQTINVGLRCARTLRWNETHGADKRSGFIHVRDEPGEPHPQER